MFVKRRLIMILYWYCHINVYKVLFLCLTSIIIIQVGPKVFPKTLLGQDIKKLLLNWWQKCRKRYSLFKASPAPMMQCTTVVSAGVFSATDRCHLLQSSHRWDNDLRQRWRGYTLWAHPTNWQVPMACFAGQQRYCLHQHAPFVCLCVPTLVPLTFALYW